MTEVIEADTVLLPVIPKHPYANCDGCPLYSVGTYVPSTLPTKPCSTGNQLALVGEAPGAQEVKKGRPFIGPSGEIVDRLLDAYDIDRDEVLITNASACHYPKEDYDKLPPAAVEHCRPRLLYELSQVNTQTAVTLGAHAVKSLIDTKEGITMARAGGPRPSSFDPNILVIPTFHPAFAMRDHTVFPLISGDFAKIGDGVWDKWQPVNYRVIQTALEANHEIARLWRSVTGPIVADTESGADKDDTFGGAIKDLLCVGIHEDDGTELGVEIVFPREVFNDNNRRLMGKWFVRNGLKGQHLKYDIARVLNVYLGVDGLLDIPVKGDTMLKSYALRSGVRGIHGLDYLGRERLGTPRWKHWVDDSMERGRQAAKAEAKARKEKLGDRFNGKNYGWIDRDTLHKYNAYDVAVTHRLEPGLDAELAEHEGLPELYNRLLDYSQMLIHVEQRGMMIDMELNYELERQLNGELSDLDFASILGGFKPQTKTGSKDFNPRSVPHVKQFLEFTGLQVEDTRARTIKGLRDLYEVTQERPDVVEFCNTLLDSRDLGKQLSTYVIGLRKTLVDGIAHPDYSLMSSTGRLRARNPNSQNTPQGSKLRRQYVARPGKVYVQGDYGQAELRVMAYLAKDMTLRQMFMSPGDLFTDMCIDLYPHFKGLPGEEQKNLRKLIKTIAYGTAYNRGANAIALDFGIPVSRARKIQRDFNAKIPDVIKYRDKIMEIALNCGDLVTVFGRRRQFRLVTGQNMIDIGNEAAAHMPQSTANDICLTSAVELDKGGLPIVNLIHDAIIAEVDKCDAEEVGHLMRTTMIRVAENVTEGFVPWKVDIETGRSYGDFEK